jgi:hypothetical protein
LFGCKIQSVVLAKGKKANVPRGASPLDAARSVFSSVDTGVKRRKLVGM